MKAALLELLAGEPHGVQARNTAREYLQARILLALQDHGAFSDWAFLGGTALRFRYRLPRYSEDLDFSLITPGGDGRFAALMRAARHDLTAEAYAVEATVRTRSAVAVGRLKFRGLLHEAGLSPHAEEVLAIRVEVDTNPPAGAHTETQLIRRFGLLNLLYHDRASLFAGKLHAVLTRGYTKGRDLFDLAWYLADPTWPAPGARIIGAPVEPCVAPRFGANVLLAGEARLVAKLHRSRPGGWRPARASFSLRVDAGQHTRLRASRQPSTFGQRSLTRIRPASQAIRHRINLSR